MSILYGGKFFGLYARYDVVELKRLRSCVIRITWFRAIKDFLMYRKTGMSISKYIATNKYMKNTKHKSNTQYSIVDGYGEINIIKKYISTAQNKIKFISPYAPGQEEIQ